MVSLSSFLFIADRICSLQTIFATFFSHPSMEEIVGEFPAKVPKITVSYGSETFPLLLHYPKPEGFPEIDDDIPSQVTAQHLRTLFQLSGPVSLISADGSQVSPGPEGMFSLTWESHQGASFKVHGDPLVIALQDPKKAREKTEQVNTRCKALVRALDHARKKAEATFEDWKRKALQRAKSRLNSPVTPLPLPAPKLEACPAPQEPSGSPVPPSKAAATPTSPTPGNPTAAPLSARFPSTGVLPIPVVGAPFACKHTGTSVNVPADAPAKPGSTPSLAMPVPGRAVAPVFIGSSRLPAVPSLSSGESVLTQPSKPGPVRRPEALPAASHSAESKPSSFVPPLIRYKDETSSRVSGFPAAAPGSANLVPSRASVVSGNPTQPVQASKPIVPDVLNTVVCDRCLVKIPLRNVELHCLNCAKRKVPCSHCGAHVDSELLMEHIKQEHTLATCECTQRVLARDLASHKSSFCPLRPAHCNYCELDIPFKEFHAHKQQCGSRTEPCEQCGQRYELRVLPEHFRRCSAEVSSVTAPEVNSSAETTPSLLPTSCVSGKLRSLPEIQPPLFPEALGTPDPTGALPSSTQAVASSCTFSALSVSSRTSATGITRYLNSNPVGEACQSSSTNSSGQPVSHKMPLAAQARSEAIPTSRRESLDATSRTKPSPASFKVPPALHPPSTDTGTSGPKVTFAMKPTLDSPCVRDNPRPKIPKRVSFRDKVAVVTWAEPPSCPEGSPRETAERTETLVPTPEPDPDPQLCASDEALARALFEEELAGAAGFPNSSEEQRAANVPLWMGTSAGFAPAVLIPEDPMLVANDQAVALSLYEAELASVGERNELLTSPASGLGSRLHPHFPSPHLPTQPDINQDAALARALYESQLTDPEEFPQLRSQRSSQRPGAALQRESPTYFDAQLAQQLALEENEYR